MALRASLLSAFAASTLLAACGPSATPRPDPTPVATDPSLASSPGAAADATRESPEPIAPGQVPLTPGETAAPLADAPAATPPSAAELAAVARTRLDAARPAFEAHCARCHQPGQKKAKKGILAHFAMGEVYTGHGHGGASLTTEIRQVLGIGGGRATMPMDKPGAVTGAELEAIAAWCDAQDAADAAAAAPK